MQIALDPHPSLDARAFVTELPAPLHALPAPGWLTALLAPAAVLAGTAPALRGGASLTAPALRGGAPLPLAPDERVRGLIRDLLRHGGYKPTGRGKPASEYLVRAAEEGGLRTINLAVDACNAVSLHSGLPISVVDTDKLAPPLRIGLGGAGERYVFNASGQEIDVAGLLCLFDREGPCANAVKDAQRTKTSDATRSTLTVIWGTRELRARSDAALAFYCGLLERAGARTRAIELG
jgi:DNA/RNA-binding domain of Phe-tRNA-synthetase-like protein